MVFENKKITKKEDGATIVITITIKHVGSILA
jgi:hypothetical protein